MSLTKNKTYILSSLLMQLVAFRLLSAFPSGAPTSGCILRMPKHGSSQTQSSPPPFFFKLSKNSYQPSDEINVTVTSNLTNRMIRGFLLVARRVSDNADMEELIGTFVQFAPEVARGRSWYSKDVINPDFNCLTHKDSTDKDSLLVTWKAPAQSVGDIAFSLTVVENFSTFWVNMRSPIIKAESPSVDPPFSGTIKINAPAPKEFDGCGKDYGCVMSPAFCTAPYHLNCDLVVSYQLDENAQTVTIKMAAITPAYLSLAFSNDRIMGNDSTITCTMSKDKKFVSLQHGYNPGFFNERHRITGYNMVELNRFSDDDRLYCQFTRPLALGYTRAIDQRDKNSSFNQIKWSLGVDTNWYIFVATGITYDETDVVGKHSELPAISSSTFTLRDKRIVYAYRIPSMVQAHGSLMLLAWLAFISVAMVTASYYKQVLSKEFGGIKLWFHIHRSLIMFAYFAAVISIILIFVYLKKWTSNADLHGILGLIAMGAATLQIIVGMVRPAPTHKNRRIFFWVHRILGPTTHLFAIAAMISTYAITVLSYPLKRKLVIVISTWLLFHIVFHIIAHYFNTIVQRDTSVEPDVTFDRNLGAADIQRPTANLVDISKTKALKILKFCYGFYLIGIVIFFSLAISFVCSH